MPPVLPHATGKGASQSQHLLDAKRGWDDPSAKLLADTWHVERLYVDHRASRLRARILSAALVRGRPLGGRPDGRQDTGEPPVAAGDVPHRAGGGRGVWDARCAAGLPRGGHTRRQLARRRPGMPVPRADGSPPEFPAAALAPPHRRLSDQWRWRCACPSPQPPSSSHHRSRMSDLPRIASTD